nr:GntR family transcriptional regulator [Tepidanaerobacter acetatoxydans]
MGLPIYLQIVEDIKEKINTGQLKPGDAIYSENALSKAYNARLTLQVQPLMYQKENLLRIFQLLLGIFQDHKPNHIA